MLRAGVVVAVVLMASVMTLTSAKTIIPYPYPLFKQCDSRWANNQMGTNASCSACGEQPATVCEQGCAMSCVTMAMAGNGVKIPKPDGSGTLVSADPGSMNAWLHATSGYWCAWGDCNNLMLTAPDRLSTTTVNISFVSENEKPALPVLQMWLLTGGYAPVLHVRNKTHFVLCIGWDDANESTLLVNDPGFSQTSYDYSEVADILLYTILPTNSQPLVYQPTTTAPYDGPTTGWLREARTYRAPSTEEEEDSDSMDQ